jgi:hypothetical protein
MLWPANACRRPITSWARAPRPGAPAFSWLSTAAVGQPPFLVIADRGGGSRVAPGPAQGIGEDGAAVLARVAALAPGRFVVVFLEFTGRLHLQVAELPVAARAIEVGPILRASGQSPRAAQGHKPEAPARGRHTATARKTTCRGLPPADRAYCPLVYCLSRAGLAANGGFWLASGGTVETDGRHSILHYRCLANRFFTFRHRPPLSPRGLPKGRLLNIKN